MWRAYRAAGREWPVLSSDEVVDFKVMEAVALKIQKEDADAHDKQMRKDWKRKTEDLRTRVESGGGITQPVSGG